MRHEKKKALAIMQARMGSTRLPGKVLKEVNGESLLAYELSRLAACKTIDTIVVATSTEHEDDAIEALCKELGVACFRGSLADVLDRYHRCAQEYPDHDIIVRVTGDCPLIDPRVVDEVVELFSTGTFDYVSNIAVGEETYPDGMDVEVFSKEALIDAAERATLPSDREHVAPFIRNDPETRHGKISSPERNGASYRLTVDTPEDFAVVKFLIERMPRDATFLDYMNALDSHPEVRALNSSRERNEGYKKSLAEDQSHG